MKKEYEIAIKWAGFPLHPEIPEHGMTLDELFKGQPVDIDGIIARLKAVADDLGLPMTDHRTTYNSRLAQEVGHWAESEGKGDEFHNAVFTAYFAEGKNIGKVSVLADLAKSVGLSPEQANEVIETRAFKKAVDTDWQLSREKDIKAVPTFKFNGQTLVGAQSYEALERLVLAGNVKKRQ
ncbi:MAG: thioredoxin domain-containing protein [Desulfobacteraceae bacterium]|nr:thioredoxin domain-containing protein [Desulfobacteraceae bacterium]